MVGYKDGTFYRRGEPMSTSERMDRYSQFDEAVLVRQQREIGKHMKAIGSEYFDSGNKDKANSSIESIRSKYPDHSRYIDTYGNQIIGTSGNAYYLDFALEQEQDFRRNPVVKRARARVAARRTKV
jgi:hypothetical protein